MQIDIEMMDETMVVRPSGELDLAVADSLRGTLEEALDGQPVRNLVFNLARVTFIDSSGLGVLLGRYKRVSRNGGHVYIVGAQPQVRRIIELSGLFRIMGEYPSEVEALDKIG
ncbi:MAG: anti-sigma F factor antagonist [Firmicutes bacterium]|nr:anti-sigma F factor antagonist [Bacillota bacterium]